MSDRPTRCEEVTPSFGLTRVLARVQGAADEAETVLRRQAFGEGIAVEEDTAAVAGGPDGAVWVRGSRSNPFHAALLDIWLEEWDGWRTPCDPGTVYLSNDPYRGGSSLQDVRMVAPLFVDSHLAGFVAVAGRLDDVGGRAAWGVGAQAMDVFEEGVRILPTIAAQGWILAGPVCDMLVGNCRNPVAAHGDLQAMADALRTGSVRLAALLDRTGLEGMSIRGDHLAARAVEAGIAALAGMKPGSYLCRERMDGSEPGSPGSRLMCDVTVGADGITFDFAGSDAASRGSLNGTASAIRSACVAAWWHIFPTVPAHSAIRRCLKVRIPDGSFLNARFPAATGGSTSQVAPRVIAAVLEAASPAAPGRGQAAGAGGSALALLQGTAGGLPYALRLNVGGGGGASGRGDGLSNGDTGAHHSRFPSAEYLERNYPVRVVTYGLRPHSGGAGRYRGGLGTCLELELLEGPVRLNLYLDRSYRGAGGLLKGARGARTTVGLRLGGRWEAPPGHVCGVRMQAGDRLRLETAGGGGYGHPCERSIRLATKELREGLCTRREAAHDYGVVFRSGADLDFDSARTFRLRSYRLTSADVEPLLDEVDDLE